MTPENFFGQADLATNLFWVVMCLIIIAIGIIWHLRAKRILAHHH